MTETFVPCRTNTKDQKALTTSWGTNVKMDKGPVTRGRESKNPPQPSNNNHNPNSHGNASPIFSGSS